MHEINMAKGPCSDLQLNSLISSWNDIYLEKKKIKFYLCRQPPSKGYWGVGQNLELSYEKNQTVVSITEVLAFDLSLFHWNLSENGWEVGDWMFVTYVLRNRPVKFLLTSNSFIHCHNCYLMSLTFFSITFLNISNICSNILSYTIII